MKKSTASNQEPLTVIIAETKNGETTLTHHPTTNINKEPTIDEKVAVMHAVWLCAYGTWHHEVVMPRAATLLRLSLRDFHEIILAMDDDWKERIWCSRPANWKPSDSLRKIPR